MNKYPNASRRVDKSGGDSIQGVSACVWGLGILGIFAALYELV